MLLEERPLATALKPAHRSTHCDHCLGRAGLPIPCPACPVLWCSLACRDTAQSAHRWECGPGDRTGRLAASRNRARLAYRLLVQQEAGWWADRGPELLAGGPGSQAGSTAGPPLLPGQYSSLYSLLAHRDNTPQQVILSTLVATIALVLSRRNKLLLVEKELIGILIFF